MAAKLDIADQSYKVYELNKRDIPLSVIVLFYEKFDVSLN